MPVMHSPPRQVDPQEAANWKIPPAISNWKNAKGYIIPLDKRLAADGRALQETKINDNFAKMSEALYLAEQKAREDTELRNRVAKEQALREKERKDAEMRALAMQARLEKMGAGGGAAARAEPVGGPAIPPPPGDGDAGLDIPPPPGPRSGGSPGPRGLEDEERGRGRDRDFPVDGDRER